MNRLWILAGAVAMQLCLGATYAWSVFVGPLRAATGMSQGEAQLPFALFYLVFPFTTIFAGRIVERWGPRRSAVAGSLLFAAGWMLASQGSRSFLLTIAGIGILSGAGVGLAYLVPIAVGVRWFPRRKGLITGFAVAGFGGGAALVSLLAGELMVSRGVDPFAAFAWLGVAFALVGSAGASAMRFPSGEAVTAAPPLGAGAILKEKPFRYLYVAMVTGLAAGFAVNANLTKLLSPADLTAGSAAVALFALANAGGRFAWGAMFDASSAAKILTANLLAQAVVVIAAATQSMIPFPSVVIPLLAGFNYGGVLVLYAATSSRVWGGKRVAEVYGLLFSANIVAAPVPVLFALGHDWTGSFNAGLVILFLLLAAGAALVWRGRAYFNILMRNQ